MAGTFFTIPLEVYGKRVSNSRDALSQGRVPQLGEPIPGGVVTEKPHERTFMPVNDEADLPITFEELLSRCMGELQFAQKVLENFVSTCEPQLDGLRRDLENSDWEALSRKVHRLKGTAATIAARPLCESLEQLEVLVHSEDLNRTDKTRQGINLAASECKRIDHYVQSGLANSAPLQKKE